jgi:hypothetical protein
MIYYYQSFPGIPGKSIQFSYRNDAKISEAIGGGGRSASISRIKWWILGLSNSHNYGMPKTAATEWRQ